MENVKKITIKLIIIIVVGLIFLSTNIVKAEDTEIVVECNKEINTEILENVKASRLKVLLTPRIKVEANPTQEDITKYYYNQLKNDVSKNTYKALTNQISNKILVNLNNAEYGIKEATEQEIANCFQTNLLPYVLDGYEAYIMDDGTNYWWNTDLKFGEIKAEVSNGIAKYKTVELISNTAEWSDYANFNIKLNELSNSITGNNVYEIVKSINSYICNNIEYTILDDTNIEQTAYGALMLKKAVCEGQTQLFNLICRKKGVQSLNVYGFTNEKNVSTAHAWNYVYEPSKGQWYAVDVTWNNYYKNSEYLMVGTNTEVNGIKFGKNHLAGFRQFTLQTYTPSTPILASERYEEEQEEPKPEDNTYIQGDANGDKKINSTDTLLIFRHIFASKNKGKHDEWILTGDKFLASDVTKDNKIDSSDSLVIFRYIAATKSTKIAKKHPEWITTLEK